MTPVFDVVWLGIAFPENEASWLLCKQSIAVQLYTVTKSQPLSVAKVENRSVTERAPVGAMIALMSSELLYIFLSTPPLGLVHNCVWLVI